MRGIGILLLACAAPGLAEHRRNVEAKENIERAFSGARAIEIDNLNGFIHVTGSAGPDARMTVNKIIRAESSEKVQDAGREVKLDITEQQGTVRLYVDGPFRCNCSDRNRGFRNHHDPGYEVTFDFTLRVPAAAKVWLRTVNNGDIRLENTSGDFDVENINGGLELREVSGSGRAYALNHPLKVLFSRNPARDSFFGSLNGDVEVTFLPGLSADFRIKTFNGQAYTDFPVTAVPVAAQPPERKGTKFVYRSNGFHGVRAGNGGPEIKFDAFNGNIRILERK